MNVNQPLSVLERLASLALPHNERDVVLADLREESAQGSGRGPLWRAVQSLRIAGRFHGECYRDLDDRWRIVGLLAASLSLLWSIPFATGDSFAVAETYFFDPFGRALVRFWGASHITSAIAAGLVIGRLRLVPEHAAAARWHVAIVASTALLARHGAPMGGIGVILLLVATWLGDGGRKAGPDGATPLIG